MYQEVVEHQHTVLGLFYQAQHMLEYNKSDFSAAQLQEVESTVTDLRERLEHVCHSSSKI